MATLKDKTYHYTRLTQDFLARIPNTIFRLWDPLTTWLVAIAKRAAELSADLAQLANDRYIDSASGDRLDRLLDNNEGIPRVLGVASSDGTIMLTRQTAPDTPYTFAIGTLQVQKPPDPSNPSAARPTFVNTEALTIETPATAWSVAFQATTGGLATNLPAATVMQLTTNANLLDGAYVDDPFTNGTDTETDQQYRLRGKLAMRSRSKGTKEALVAAALTAGAFFVFMAESFDDGDPPVTLYVADVNGNLPDALAEAVQTYVDGDDTVSPPIPMARAAGIAVDVQPAETVEFDFSIDLIVRDDVIGDALTTLRANITASITGYIDGLNVTTGTIDRTMRPNRVKDCCIAFQSSGLLDVVDGTFLPAAPVPLTSPQMAVMGTITWL